MISEVEIQEVVEELVNSPLVQVALDVDEWEARCERLIAEIREGE